jgi:signal transduction histidine kinase
MIRRWPIRVRLAAAFTAMMALVLLAVAWVTLHQSREALDESTNAALSNRLGRLLAIGATPSGPGLPGGTEGGLDQILSPSGQLIATTGEQTDPPLLAGAELAAARRAILTVEHPSVDRIPGTVRIMAAATPDGNGIAATAMSLANRDAVVADLRRELTVAFPLVLVAAAVGAYVLAAAALRPVERMRSRAATITADDPGQRLVLSEAKDEIARLGTTFNELLQRLHTALDHERQFVADASHELRTPLSLVTTELELALRRPRTNQELTRALESALEETHRLTRLAQDLLLLTRTENRVNTPRTVVRTELRHLLETVVARYRATTVELDCPDGLAVYGDSDQIDRAVTNLIDNAIEHGAPPISMRVRPENDPLMVTVDVRDHGPGFDPEFLPHAFERFTQADTARTGRGAGLGLAIAEAIAARNRGRLHAANHPLGGAVLTLILPTTAPAQSQSAANN